MLSAEPNEMFYSYQIMNDHIKNSSNQHNILKIAQLSDDLLSERSGISRAAELYKHKINGLLIGVNISGLQIRGVLWSWLISAWWKICFTGFWCAGVVVLTLDAQGFYFSPMDGSNLVFKCTICLICGHVLSTSLQVP